MNELIGSLLLVTVLSLCQQRDYENADKYLTIVNKLITSEENVAKFHYCKAITAYGLNKTKEANEECETILSMYSPRRYQMVALAIQKEIEQEEDGGKNPLLKISKKMDWAERNIGLKRIGEKTQKKQDEIVKDLDKLIKEIEDTKNKNDDQIANSTHKHIPLEDSIIQSQTGPGNVDPKRLKEISAVWGKLPEKERAKAMVELTRGMPPKYREVVENYFRKLAQQQKSP